MADRKMRHRNRVLPTIWLVWLIAGLIGDELVGVVLFGLESDALLMSLTQRSWWVYQGVLLALAVLASLVATDLDRRTG